MINIFYSIEPILLQFNSLLCQWHVDFVFVLIMRKSSQGRMVKLCSLEILQSYTHIQSFNISLMLIDMRYPIIHARGTPLDMMYQIRYQEELPCV